MLDPELDPRNSLLLDIALPDPYACAVAAAWVPELDLDPEIRSAKDVDLVLTSAAPAELAWDISGEVCSLTSSLVRRLTPRIPFRRARSAKEKPIVGHGAESTIPGMVVCMLMVGDLAECVL